MRFDDLWQSHHWLGTSDAASKRRELHIDAQQFPADAWRERMLGHEPGALDRCDEGDDQSESLVVLAEMHRIRIFPNQLQRDQSILQHRARTTSCALR